MTRSTLPPPTSPPLLLLLLLLCGSNCQRRQEPSEFVASFLSRPHLLPNATTIPGTRDDCGDTPCVDLVVDNWSPYVLKPTPVPGSLDYDLSSSRDVSPTRRDFVARADVNGAAAWRVQDEDEDEVSRLSVAWRLQQGGVGSTQRFGVALGGFVPTLGDMLRDGTESRLQAKVGKEVGKLLAVADSLVTVAVRLERPAGNHYYRMQVSLVPQNMDIWFWTKYRNELVRVASRPSGPSDHEHPPQVGKVVVTNGSRGERRRKGWELLLVAVILSSF